VRQQNRRFTRIRILTAGFLLLALTIAPQPSSAGSLSTAIIGMFPKNVGSFTYADLKSARKFPWYPQLREQLLPGRVRDIRGRGSKHAG
jgi:hypothetical protein